MPIITHNDDNIVNENDFNREQQAILDAWDNEKRISCERGTKIHAELENSFTEVGLIVSGT